MSLKIFSGLGQISHPFDAEGQTTSAVIQESPVFGTSNATITVDHVATPILGNMNNPSMIPQVFSTLPSVVTDGVSSAAVTSPLTSAARRVGPAAPSFIKTTPQVPPELVSLESGPAVFETLFHDFDIEVFPTYNFWVSDELTNDSQAAGDRKLEDIPRYNRVVWNPAPDLAKQYEIKPRTGKSENGTPVQLGTQINKPTAVTVKGVQFTPKHLNDFQLIKRSLANGQVSPGTVHAVVEMPSNTSGLSHPVVSTEPYCYLDEETFLQHPDFQGMSFEEIKSNIHSLTNGVLNAGRVNNETVSADLTEDKEGLFSGKFSVEKPPTNGGVIHIQGVHASSPPLGMRARVATAGESQTIPLDPILEQVRKIQSPDIQIPDSTSTQIRANFVIPSLGGLLKPEKINSMQAPEHAENVVALAQVLPSLEVMNAAGLQNSPRQIDIPGFSSPPGLPHIQYVGYVLEKYERNSNGTFVLKETIDIPHIDYNTYIDSKIKYGQVYRYRIKVILRWTRPSFMGIMGADPTLNGGISSQTKGLAPYHSSYFGGEWSKNWAYGLVLDTVAPSPPDELTVRPDSARKQIVVSFKLPLNQQRDIFYMRLFRKLQDQNGVDLTGWMQVGSQWGPENVLFYDSDVDFFQKNHIRYVYAAQTFTRHNEYSPLSDQLATRLNQEYRTYGEYGVDFVSQAGVKLELHGAFGTYPFKRLHTEIVAPNDSSFVFLGREVMGGNIALDDAQYFVRLESLDTGEKKTYPIRLVYNNQKSRIEERQISVSVPAHKLAVSTKKSGNSSTKSPVFRDWKPRPLPRSSTNTKPIPRVSLSPQGIK